MDSKGKKSLLDVPGYVYFSWFSGAFDLCHVHEMSITCKLVRTQTHTYNTQLVAGRTGCSFACKVNIISTRECNESIPLACHRCLLCFGLRYVTFALKILCNFGNAMFSPLNAILAMQCFHH